MRLIATIKMAFRAMRRNKMRSMLTMLGIIIGVAAVITTVSIGNGAKAQVEAQIATLGQNVILIFSGSTSRGGMSYGWGSAATLTAADAEALRREVPGVIGVSPEVRTGGQIAAGNANWSTQIMGESEEYLAIRQWPLKEGSFFTAQDVKSAAKVAVIGQTVVEKIFPEGDAVGKILRIRNAPFIIVGVLASKGMSMMGSDQDDVVIVPYTSAMRRLSGSSSLRSINVQAESPAQMEAVQYEISSLLRQRHKIREGGDDDFIIRTQQEIAEAANESSKVMRNLIAVLAGVSLLVGGIGIMNIMLVSVTERTREIGIRLAVGAKSGDILVQFLVEALVLSTVGGLLGIAVGLGLPKIVQTYLGWAVLTSTDSILVALVCSSIIGIFFGFYPARKAAQLDPINALRYE